MLGILFLLKNRAWRRFASVVSDDREALQNKDLFTNKGWKQFQDYLYSSISKQSGPKELEFTYKLTQSSNLLSNCRDESIIEEFMYLNLEKLSM